MGSEADRREEAELRAAMDLARLPRHIAIIMDGNGRWAKQRGLPRVEGHRRGAERVRALTETCAQLGVGALTLYAFSTENRKRPWTEVRALMSLLKTYLKQEVPTMMRNNIRLHVIGRWRELPHGAAEAVERSLATTSVNTGMFLNLALNYGARDELVRAARSLAAQCCAGAMTPEALDEDLLAGSLDTARLPELDLLIRTSGEVRISNFLLWQLSYAELVFTDVLWPDFDLSALYRAIIEFQSRKRRFGLVDAQGEDPA